MVDKEQQDIRRLFNKKGRWTGLAIVILGALLLVAIATIQFYYTRSTLERYLEEQVLIMLRSSAMRMDGNLNAIVEQASNQIWHAQQHLDNPKYMETMVTNLVKSGSGRVWGAAVAFQPNFYPQKGHWYEPYAQWNGGNIKVLQIGSAEHDYFNMEFYKGAITGDTLNWSTPYMDETGAGSEVVTYSLPIRDASGKPVAVLGIDVTTKWISKSLRQIRLHPSSFSLVLSEKGEVISMPSDGTCSKALANKISAMIADPKVSKDGKSGSKLMSFKFYNEEKDCSGRVYYTKKDYQPMWTMVKVVHDNEAFAELAEMQRRVFWTSLIGLAVLILIIQLFARNTRKLQDTLMEQQRTDRELQIANGIQQALLPFDEPTLRDVEQVKVWGCLIPARDVGGDLYNVFVRDGKLFFCIGDVSGKSVPSALIMAVTQTLFHNVASVESNPARIVERMNVSVCRHNQSNMFVTLFIGVLDLQSGHLDYCNAGHERPMLGDRPLPTIPNMPIGAFSDFSYQPQEATIAAGETLILYTDGLTEALNAQHQLFGRHRAIQLMARCSGMAPREIVDTVVGEISQYAGETKQSDDMTLLAIRYQP